MAKLLVTVGPPAVARPRGHGDTAAAGSRRSGTSPASLDCPGLDCPGLDGTGQLDGTGGTTPASGARTGTRRSVAIVGTYPPTMCGLATFTSNVREALTACTPDWDVRVVRVLDHAEPVPAAEVVAQWVPGDRTSLGRARDALKSSDVVVVQHEYGLFGPDDGIAVLDLVDEMRSPLVVVLHTALLEPSLRQRRILDHLIGAASAVIVQSDAARRHLAAIYGCELAGVVVVPHGAAENFVGPVLEDVPHPAVLSWGLLSPGKGIEHGIAAVARLGSRRPPPTFVVAGQTHPKVRAAHGEVYRESLAHLARDLGAADRVRFDDSYRDWASLRALVRSADVVLLPYDSREQVSSGVLAEALASGKPVVATRFPHAVELLGGGAGILVDQGDVVGMSEALDRVLYHPTVARAMATAARRAAIPFLWPAVGLRYRTVLEGALAGRALA